MSRKVPHTRTTKGMRVYVETRGGGAFVDHFVERTRSKIVIFRTRKVPAGAIAVFRQARPDER